MASSTTMVPTTGGIPSTVVAAVLVRKCHVMPCLVNVSCRAALLLQESQESDESDRRQTETSA
eukprot:889377-Rhodomonas_salina.1